IQKLYFLMATTADLNSEENFIAHWMSSASRAGVVLNPSFHSLKATRETCLSGMENLISPPIKIRHCSNCSSISEDSLHEEQTLKSVTDETLFPGAEFNLANKEQMLTFKEASAQWETPSVDFECDEMGDHGEGACTDPLLRKLDQLKELQQQKQEQLKRRQMEQLQRLMEERHKLLSIVSSQQAVSGKLRTEHCQFTLYSGVLMCVKIASISLIVGAHRFNVSNCIFKNRPIKAGIQESRQTFEEFLEEQIRLEEKRLNQKDNLQEVGRSAFPKPVTKQPFLKRGEGLSRFTNAKSKLPKHKESKMIAQQNFLEDKNLFKADKPQMHRKTAPLNKEQVSETFASSKNCNQVGKTRNELIFPAQKAAVLRTCNKKSIFLTTRTCSDNKLDGQLKDSFRTEIDNKMENNKENMMEFAKPIEIGSKIRNKLPDAGKLQMPTELSKNLSLLKYCISHPVKDPESSFELSFQNKFENWEKEKEKEDMELDEFLFLEQAADEVSFSSNSSFVQRILDRDQQTSKDRRMSSTPVKSTQQQQMNALDITAINNKNIKHHLLSGNKNEREITCTIADSINPRNCFNKTNSIIFQTTSEAEITALKSNKQNARKDESDESSDVTTESEEELEITIKSVNEDAKKLTLNRREDNPEFGDFKGPAKDTSKESKSRDVDLDLSDRDSSSDESSVTSEHSSKDSESRTHVPCPNKNKVEFDDERTWTDLEENEIQQVIAQSDPLKVPLQTDHSSKSEGFVLDKAVKRKVASRKQEDFLSKQSARVTDSSTPPTSDLMMKLFPSLKPKQNVDSRSRHETKLNTGQEDSGDTVRSQVLREKLVELETEIERFRAENASLTKLREERECALQNLRKEISDFEQQKAKELLRLEEFKKEETKKLQKERKVFEKYATAARAIPDKKERDEIQTLKQQITDFHEDLKRKEAKWSTTHGRLRNQIEALTKENTELREEIKIMERFRLETWKRAEAAENRKAEPSGMKLKRPECAVSYILDEKTNSSYTVYILVGKQSRRPKSAPAVELSTPDKTMMTLEDSSRTFMVEKLLKNGCHLIFYPNGTRKEVSSDGKTLTVTFFNGDVKQVMADQRVIYYYADAQTTHTTYPNGLEVLHFSNGQIEKHYSDGRKEITFPDQTIKNLLADGQEESIFPDGTIVRVQRDGNKIIEFNNGQRELHTAHFKRREYPDGTIKTVYANGHQETKYVSGRVRVKDKDGNVIMDTKL
uniref:Centrosomal P4.1-associated protein n=1 Tax=Sphenodon punctatus TaxID=8508 RepID=A0A8D0GXL2_SPHPU